MKKCLEKLIAVVIGGFLITFCSCANKELQVANLEETPYATVEELEAISNQSDDYVDYKVARTLAMLELVDIEPVTGWSSNSVLSEKPVIVWKNFEQPEYYEYHVFDNNMEVGYITCNINKKAGEPVAYIGNDVKVYYVNDSRCLSGNDVKIFSVEYPSVTLATNDRSVDIVENELTDEECYEQWLDSLTDEELALSGFTKQTAMNEFLNQKKDNEKRLDTLWNLIYEQKENLLNLTDEEIIKVAAYESAVNARSSLVENSNENTEYKEDFVFVEPYASRKGNRRRFSYCVPSVIEFICQTYCDDNNINLTDSQIYDAIDSVMGDQCQYALFDDYKYKQALSDGTSGNLTSDFSLFHDFDSITSNLKTNKLPVISDRSGGTTIFGLFVEGHCRAITGTCKTQRAVQKWFLWINWTEWEKNGYYYMWDNGHDYDKSPTSNDVSYSTYTNKANDHFWEKDGTWFYKTAKAVKTK